jgi:hypothetical protein
VGTLTFASGSITTGASRVSIGPAGTVVGASASGYVSGNLERFVPNAAAPSVVFPIGDATAYAPVSIDFTGTTTAATVPDTGTATVSTIIAIRLADRYGNASSGPGGTISVLIAGANAGSPVGAITATGGGANAAAYTPAQPGVDSVFVLVNATPVGGSPFVHTVVAAVSRLSLSLSASAPNPVVGDTITIQMTVVNLGTGPAGDAQLASEIPIQRFTVLSLVVSQGSFDTSTRIWSLGNLAPQAAATLTFRGIVRLFPSP